MCQVKMNLVFCALLGTFCLFITPSTKEQLKKAELEYKKILCTLPPKAINKYFGSIKKNYFTKQKSLFSLELFSILVTLARMHYQAQTGHQGKYADNFEYNADQFLKNHPSIEKNPATALTALLNACTKLKGSKDIIEPLERRKENRPPLRVYNYQKRYASVLSA